MNDDDLKLVVDYFRNKASELEMSNLDLQLQLLKVQKELNEFKGEQPDESTD